MSLFGQSYGANITGSVFVQGKRVEMRTVADAIRHKIAYVTEDRKGNGLVLNDTIRMNTTLANLRRISNLHRLDKDLEIHVASEYKRKLNVKCSSIEQNVGNLSGGNQQKVLLSMWMFTEPDILILDEPTRGIDVGAKYEIYRIMNDLAAEGKSILMISSEMPELLGMCDRIYVMNEGRIVTEFARTEASQEAIMASILSSSKGA
jgi:putative multiple sugar transport system ATP-binding protein